MTLGIDGGDRRNGTTSWDGHLMDKSKQRGEIPSSFFEREHHGRLQCFECEKEKDLDR